MEPERPDRSTDESTVDCVTARELVSAATDGELAPAELQRLDDHLAGCAPCEEFQAGVASLARVTRVRVAHVDEPLVASIMQRSHPARLGRGGWMRPALVWCGLLIAAQSVAPLVFGSADGAPAHVARHVGASTLALAIGLLYVAWKPQRAFGLLPYVAALLAAMLGGAVFDLVSGERSPVSELVHLAELAGMVLVWMVAGSPGWDRVAVVAGGRWRRASLRL